VSGDKKPAKDYIEGLNMLSNMRLCANVPGQWAIQTALGGHQSINELVNEGGPFAQAKRPGLRAHQRDPRRQLASSPMRRCTCFPGSTPRFTRSRTISSFSLELLQETKVMLVQGTGFNWAAAQIISELCFCRIEDDLREAIEHESPSS
jgi:alanine-synthesizing transaminase